MYDNSGDNNIKRFQAKNLEQAIKEASSYFNVSPDEIEYKVISQIDAGIFSFLGLKKVEIDAWVKTNSTQIQTTNEVSEASNLLQKEPTNKNFLEENEIEIVEMNEYNFEDKSFEGNIDQIESDKEETEEDEEEEYFPLKSTEDYTKSISNDELKIINEDIKKFCKNLCAFFTKKDIDVDVKLNAQRLIINITNEDIATLLSKNTKLLLAFEHIIKKRMQHVRNDLPLKIFVDYNSRRIKREQELVELAKTLSEKVAKNKRPIVLHYKNPYDRKIIHMALDKNQYVYTKSVGAGDNRKLLIIPLNYKQNSKYQNKRYERKH